jgi:hypothetical protein
MAKKLDQAYRVWLATLTEAQRKSIPTEEPRLRRPPHVKGSGNYQVAPCSVDADRIDGEFLPKHELPVEAPPPFLDGNEKALPLVRRMHEFRRSIEGAPLPLKTAA